jgi:PTS system D-glucosamine-specific IIC component
MLNIAVGLTFSGGFLDLLLFGILQGNKKTSWMLIIPVGIIYFLLYYFIFSFLIKKLDLKTPGREDDDAQTKLFSKADYLAKKDGSVLTEDEILSDRIMKGLGGKKNIIDVDCCATRLRCMVAKSELVNDAMLKATGASGVVCKGQGVQIIYGPRVTVIKANLEEYLEKAENTEYTGEAETADSFENKETEKTEKKVTRTVTISSPITGKAADLSEAPDEAFAGGMMGEGSAMTPVDNTVYAPEDGTVAFVFDTKHAIGFVTDTGVSMLLHIGIDTVKLEGRGFEVMVSDGQHVKKGEPMMKLDLEFLKSHAPSIVSPVLCTDLEDGQEVRLLHTGEIKAGEPLMEVDVCE